jgi:hypothetical protein
MAKDSFYFGDINFDKEQAKIGEFQDSWSKPTNDDLRGQLVEYVKSKQPVYEEDDAEWRFGKPIFRDDYIIGKFGKIFPDEPTQYDDVLGDFVTSKQEDADVSFFILFLDKMAIAFNRKLRIGPEQFATAFSTGFNRYNFESDSKFIDVEIKEWSEDIDEVLQSADKVYSLDFDLETTNPGPTDEMETMDDRFKEAEADEFGVDMQSDNGLFTGAKVVRAAVDFVKENYGDGVIKFERDGRSEQYSTKSKTATKNLDEPEELSDMKKHVEELSDQIEALTITSDDDD